MQYLRQLQMGGVHRLRLLSIVSVGAWHSAAATAMSAPPGGDSSGAQQPRLQLEAPGWQRGRQPAATAPAPAAWHPPGAAVAAPAAALQALPAAPADQQAPPADEQMLWGELHAREPRRGLAALLPRAREDVAQRLVGRVSGGRRNKN